MCCFLFPLLKFLFFIFYKTKYMILVDDTLKGEPIFTRRQAKVGSRPERVSIYMGVCSAGQGKWAQDLASRESGSPD